MEENQIGMLARSKAGHDKDKLYVIIQASPEYAYLVDGRIRTLDHPKKKKWKHIQLVKYRDESIAGRLKQNELVRDEEIKRLIKTYV